MLERLASRNLEQKHRFSTNCAFEIHEHSSILVRILAYFTWRRRAAPVPSKYAKMGVVGGGGGGVVGGGGGGWRLVFFAIFSAKPKDWSIPLIKKVL